MDRFQKQSIIMMITNIEQQLANLRQLVGMTSSGDTGVRSPRETAPRSDHFTTPDEDKEIADVLGFEEDERDVFLHDLVNRSREQGSEPLAEV